MVRQTEEKEATDFRFLLLGDLHFDRMHHHDMNWLKQEKPGDIRQIENYTRITAEILPALFGELKAQIMTNPDIAFVAHIGDFVEGLAGTPALANLHCREAVAFVDERQLARPFLFCKGNHDVTGPGSVEAFDEVLLPFLGREAKQTLTPARGANYVTRYADHLFIWFDAYHRGSLDWLEAVLTKRTEKRVFLMIHPPVAPYGARSNWHIFAKPKEAAERVRLLNLLGKHRVFVLCGHLHKYGTIVRQTPAGPFVQVATVSVLPEKDVVPRREVSGVEKYGPDLVELEPEFAPQTLEERRALLAAEAPLIRYYDYADAPGYGMVQVTEAAVTLQLFAGLSRTPFRTLNLTELLKLA